MNLLTTFSCLVAFLLPFAPFVSPKKMIKSNSLTTCQEDSKFTTSLFNILLTPDNNTLHVQVIGVSSITGYVTADARVLAYGHQILNEKLNPCNIKGVDLKTLCPMRAGPIDYDFNIPDLPKDTLSSIPTVAYGVPDLDLKIRVYINETATGKSIACLEARLSNGNTVYQKPVGWIVAIVAGLGLVASAITSGLGHSNTAAHVAANALSLFGFFQAQAMVGMSSVTLPPIVQSWTQNFQWSMGIIQVGFLQRICTWYQRSTGGEPSIILSKLGSTSVHVQKRSIEWGNEFLANVPHLLKRTNNEKSKQKVEDTIVRGIERVGFRANIERTNIFMTGLIFFVFFVVVVLGLVALFKGYCEIASKKGWIKGDKFQDFRNGWKVIMRGILFRLVLIGFPQMCILCLWELTKRDSPAEVVLAVFMLISMCASLGFAAFTVIRLAKKSVELHKNPAYILYSDPSALNKWGFLYVQYRATAYYCVIPVLVYILVKGMFVGLAQPAPLVQAIALLIIEAAVLIAASVMRPWMDKKTNIFNISIAAVNFFNVILLLFFTQVFNQPGLVTGVMGVIFFVVNAVLALILLILVLISSVYAIVSKNPDTRYQPMRDDRGSFIKSQTQLTTELDALGATARGESKSFEDSSSLSGGYPNRADSPAQTLQRQQPLSPLDSSVPLFPADNQVRNAPPPTYQSQVPSGGAGYSRAQNISPAPRNLTTSPFPHSPTATSNPAQYRMNNNSSPWQRGAGYEH
ncbi:uncharacterized protein BDCG_00444 [Blastomyces dermatitidis ER-3]|uniref:ML-like domain-containing protein n=1 Tax=Ajellomyces dermatitidis (strain ER-3 / ATCC MYA-2586) TaxID=559297 RepID=A0ABP2EKH9_AJEDR|nr:uncharacterized protein BDCG_00444 [Blastomyces dermatitidis ER-3]EEQ83639.1 hypothetical protein BDCG_00444 [Blastomyces dermatitidis ER-3]